MDDPAANAALPGKGFDLGHDIVMNLGLNLKRALDIDLLLVGAQIRGLIGCYQTKFRLYFCQRRPNPAPEPAFVCFTPNDAHFPAAIAPGKGRKVVFVRESHD